MSFLGAGLLGLLLGVCTAHTLMNIPIKIMSPMPMSNTAHQCFYNKKVSIALTLLCKLLFSVVEKCNHYDMMGEYVAITYNNPISNFVECFLIKEEFLEPGQRPISINITTLLENITVTSEVITGSSCNVYCQFIIKTGE